MFWERYIELCAAANKTPHKVATSLGITSGSVTGWKNGGTPRETTLKKIANYFDVSVEYLKGETDIKNSSADDSRGMAKEAARLFSILSDERKIEAMNYLRYLAEHKQEE